MKTILAIFFGFVLVSSCYANYENQENKALERKIEAEWKRGMDQEFGNEDWTRKKRGNGGDGGKVYCPNCKIEGDTATGGDGGWFRKKRGNGGDGGKVYCPNCKIEGDTATGGDGGWFRKKREIGLIEPDVQIDNYQQNPRFRRGNGGNGGKVYCPGCKIEGDTATGGDGGWF